jgi:hypothetical protein
MTYTGVKLISHPGEEGTQSEVKFVTKREEACSKKIEKIFKKELNLCSTNNVKSKDDEMGGACNTHGDKCEKIPQKVKTTIKLTCKNQE